MDVPNPILEAEPDFQAEQYLQVRNELIALSVPEDAGINLAGMGGHSVRQVRGQYF